MKPSLRTLHGLSAACGWAESVPQRNSAWPLFNGSPFWWTDGEVGQGICDTIVSTRLAMGKPRTGVGQAAAAGDL